MNNINFRYLLLPALFILILFFFISCHERKSSNFNQTTRFSFKEIPWTKQPVKQTLSTEDTLAFRVSSREKISFQPLTERKRKFNIRLRPFGKLSETSGKKIIPEKSKVRFSKMTLTPNILKIDPPFFKDNNACLISSLGRNQGLPTGKITSLIIDHQQQVWMGSSGFGLFRYDGINLYVYNSTNGFPSDDIQCLFADKEGSIWIGTAGNGLVRYDGYNFYHTNTQNGLNDDVITSFFQDKNNHIWYSTNDNGVGMFSHSMDQIMIINSENGFEIDNFRSITQDPKGNMWFSSAGGGIYVYDFNEIKNYHSGNGIPEDIILSSCTDAYGNIWFGSDSKGLFYISPQKEVFIADKSSGLSDNCITSLAVTGGKLVAGTFDGGIHIFDENTCIPLNKKHGLLSDRIFSIYIANPYTILASGTEGINLINPYLIDFYDENDGIPSCYVKDVTFDGKNTWIATYGSGLLMLRNDSLFSVKTGKLPSLNILSIEKDEAGNIWFSTENGGLFRITNHQLYEYKNEILEEYSVFSLAEYNKHLFLGTDGSGLIQLNPQNNQALRFRYKNGLSGNIIHHLVKVKDDLFACCEKNGISIIQGDNILSISPEENGLAAEQINDIILSGKKWILATEGKGLLCFENTHRDSSLKQFQLFSPDFPTHIRNMTTDSDTWLLFCSNGFFIFRNDSIHGLIPRFHLNQKTGLNNVEFMIHSLAHDAFNYIISSTTSQLLKINHQLFHYRFLPDTPRISNIRFKEKRIDFLSFKNSPDNSEDIIDCSSSISKEFNIPEELTLSYFNNNLTLDIDAQFWHPFFLQKCQLYYSLNKNEPLQWELSDNNHSIHLNNLDPGDYFLSVKISFFHHEIINPYAIKIRILPPWWKTPWALFLWIVLLISSVWLILRLRTHQLRLQKIQLEKLVRERTRQIEEQKALIEEKNKDIMDSINYTRRLQNSSLPNERDVQNNFPDAFILYRPRDIISGDFYFASTIKTNDGTILKGIVAGDCTGHGVPGAFLSILILAYIQQSLTEKDVNSPSEAVQFVSEKMKNILKYRKEESEVKDSADLAFAVINPSDGKMISCCANNPIYVVRKGTLIEIPAQKRPVGYSDKEIPFMNHEFQTQQGDMVYLFSDGYADQFGKSHEILHKEKKFTRKQFKDLLVSISEEPTEKQKEILLQKHLEWKGDLEQTDDILVIGFRI